MGTKYSNSAWDHLQEVCPAWSEQRQLRTYTTFEFLQEVGPEINREYYLSCLSGILAGGGPWCEQRKLSLEYLQEVALMWVKNITYLVWEYLQKVCSEVSREYYLPYLSVVLAGGGPWCEQRILPYLRVLAGGGPWCGRKISPTLQESFYRYVLMLAENFTFERTCRRGAQQWAENITIPRLEFLKEMCPDLSGEYYLLQYKRVLLAGDMPWCERRMLLTIQESTCRRFTLM